METIKISSTGSDLVVRVIIGGLSRCTYNLWVKLPNSSQWIRMTKPAKTNKPAAMTNTIVPSSWFGLANWTNAQNQYIGDIGWSYDFGGTEKDTNQPYSFTLQILQDDDPLMGDSYHDAGTFTKPTYSSSSFIGTEVI